jgi:predicted transglutaminase-like cysteine proteinase
MFGFGLRILRVVGVAAGLVAFVAQSAHAVGIADGAGAGQAREPYSPALLFPAGGGALGKWLDVSRRWAEDRQALELCRTDATKCTPAAREFLAIVEDAKTRTGKAKLGQINRAVNLAIRYVDDFTAHGLVDVWNAPFATLAKHSGDCEDYAIVKFAALLEAGVPAEDVRMLIVRNAARNEDHAVVSVRHEGQWLILDNRNLLMLTDTQHARYTPLLVLHAGGGAQRYDANASAASVAAAARKAEIAFVVDPRAFVQ